MKRDWDLVRTILLRLEDLPPHGYVGHESFDGYDVPTVAYHFAIMNERGLVQKAILRSEPGNVITPVLTGLTWDGTELLDQIRNEPVDLIQWVPYEAVRANDYNPNSVAPPEMALLAHSIKADGYTQPIVTWLAEGGREVIDGFHRNRVRALSGNETGGQMTTKKAAAPRVYICQQPGCRVHVKRGQKFCKKHLAELVKIAGA